MAFNLKRLVLIVFQWTVKETCVLTFSARKVFDIETAGEMVFSSHARSSEFGGVLKVYCQFCAPFVQCVWNSPQLGSFARYKWDETFQRQKLYGDSWSKTETASYTGNIWHCEITSNETISWPAASSPHRPCTHAALSCSGVPASSPHGPYASRTRLHMQISIRRD